MKRVIIVGSAALKKDYSEIINSSDCVIRFNNCKNFNINSGTKTDILVLNNSGNPQRSITLDFMLQDRNIKKIKEELTYVYNAKEIWFTKPDPAFMKMFLLENLRSDNQIRNDELFDINEDRNLSVDIINAQKLSEKKITFMTRNLYKKIWKRLKIYGFTHEILPSTGFLGIAMLLQNAQYKDYEKYIVGFAFSGWEGHTWEQERLVVNELSKKGILIKLDNI